MKEKNLAVEMLKKLIEEQVKVYRRTKLVKSQSFSELIQQTLNRYLNGMLTNEEVIQELLKLAKEMLHASEEGNKYYEFNPTVPTSISLKQNPSCPCKNPFAVE